MFTLIFDGWTAVETNFVAIIGAYPAQNTNGYEKVMFGFTPLVNEHYLDAKKHEQLLKSVLTIFNRDEKTIVALVGDNCSVNKSLASSMLCGFDGCASHWFNLAVQEFIKDGDCDIATVRKIMMKLKCIIPFGLLRQHIVLRPKTDVYHSLELHF